jgi:hypothetical protein
MIEAGGPNTLWNGQSLVIGVCPPHRGSQLVAPSEVPRNASEARARSEGRVVAE